MENQRHCHTRVHRLADSCIGRRFSNHASRITLADLVPFIDWSPFFHTWELRGRYPAILENSEARKLFEDAQALLSQIVSQRLLAARAVYGFFPANAVGDDVELYPDESRQAVLTRFHFLRQQKMESRDRKSTRLNSSH